MCMNSADKNISDVDKLSHAELKELLFQKSAELDIKDQAIESKDQEIASYKSRLASLELQLDTLRRMQFGKKSEKNGKAEKEIEQLELLAEDIEVTDAQDNANAENSARRPRTAPKKRRVFPNELPREKRLIQPEETACPGCGGAFSVLGEDVSEMLELESIRFKVIQFVRPKLACTCCDMIVQAPAASRPIDRGIAGPGLLAHVLVGKYANHLPLYRQAEIFAREGIELERTLLADWVGNCAALLQPLIDALRAHIFAADVVHADDTPIPVLAPGNGKTKTGRLWTYVRDERPAAGGAAPGVWFAYTPDRKGIHPQRQMEGFRGVFQADGYAGFSKLYENGEVLEAACWAHVRRKFFDIGHAQKSPLAKEALERIGALYLIESEIRGQSAEARRAARQARSRPILDAMHIWLNEMLQSLSRKVEVAKAIQYALTRWKALERFCDDGRIEIDNNAAERALRCVALGRKNYLFAGSDAGGQRAAAFYSLIGSAKLNNINPEAYLREVLRRIADHPISRIEDLLPWNLKMTESEQAESDSPHAST